MKSEHTQFSGTVPANYEKYMGPMFFEPYALDIASRVDASTAQNVLEIACGTGRVTAQLLKKLSQNAKLIATDLNGGMIKEAKQRVAASNVEFKEADAQQLPFDDNSFDLVVCQFGYMFVPDKQKAFDEAYRVLKTGGKLLFNTWDRLENNELTLVIKNIVAKNFDEKAADFYSVPFSMFDRNAIESFLRNAGFQNIHIGIVTKTGTNVTALEAAKGLILGTPAFKIIVEKDKDAPARLVEIAAKELADKYGDGVIETEINAFVCEAAK